MAGLSIAEKLQTHNGACPARPGLSLQASQLRQYACLVTALFDLKTSQHKLLMSCQKLLGSHVPYVKPCPDVQEAFSVA